MSTKTLQNSELGKQTTYPNRYDPKLLFAIPREQQRTHLSAHDPNRLYGLDIWQGYEISWLDLQGKPHVALGLFVFDCHTPNLIESKSFKLYLNSFNQEKFANHTLVAEIMQKDLSQAVGETTAVTLFPIQSLSNQQLEHFSGQCIDQITTQCDYYHPNPELLTLENDTLITETLYSNLLKSNCPITNQPDWASIQIQYHGKKINQQGLLKYIVSYRNHQEFHEHCVERIFLDILKYCQPEHLTVHARYTRRGGLDINPIRSTAPIQKMVMMRLWRQ